MKLDIAKVALSKVSAKKLAIIAGVVAATTAVGVVSSLVVKKKKKNTEDDDKEFWDDLDEALADMDCDDDYTDDLDEYEDEYEEYDDDFLDDTDTPCVSKEDKRTCKLCDECTCEKGTCKDSAPEYTFEDLSKRASKIIGDVANLSKDKTIKLLKVALAALEDTNK